MKIINTQQFNKDTGFNMSAKYTAVNTATLLSQFEANGYEVGSVSSARVKDQAKQGFQKHLIRLRPAGTVMTKDSYVPEIVIKNSYDGSSSYQIMLGLFRIVCANGLVTGTAFESFRVRHVGDIMPQILVATEKVAKQLPLLAGTVQHWSSVQLEQATQLEFARQASGLILPEGAVMPRYADLLRVRRYADNANDLWSVYNRVQETIIRGGLRFNTVNEQGQVARRSGRRVTAIDRNVDLNRKLWDLAGQFAA